MREFLLRGALAFGFAYVAVSSLLSPTNWVGFLPLFVTSVIPLEQALVAIAIGELLLALWLLTGWQVRTAGLLSVFVLLGIVVFNLGALDLVFRDISMAAVALALSIPTR